MIIFFAKHYHEFNNYFPEDLAEYIFKEMKTFYDDKQNKVKDCNNEDKMGN